ncbi:TPA: hypothetical protein ACX6RO_001744 [Photobacterium damselae]
MKGDSLCELQSMTGTMLTICHGELKDIQRIAVSTLIGITACTALLSPTLALAGAVAMALINTNSFKCWAITNLDAFKFYNDYYHGIQTCRWLRQSGFTIQPKKVRQLHKNSQFELVKHSDAELIKLATTRTNGFKTNVYSFFCANSGQAEAQYICFVVDLTSHCFCKPSNFQFCIETSNAALSMLGQQINSQSITTGDDHCFSYTTSDTSSLFNSEIIYRINQLQNHCPNAAIHIQKTDTHLSMAFTLNLLKFSDISSTVSSHELSNDVINHSLSHLIGAVTAAKTLAELQ